MKSIGEFELIDHGIQLSQHFQGRRVALWEFTNVVTGTGDNPAEAITDCLEQIAQAGFDVRGFRERVCDDLGLANWQALPTTPDVTELCERHNQGEEEYPCYYISIRWNPAQK